MENEKYQCEHGKRKYICLHNKIKYKCKQCWSILFSWKKKVKL